MVLNKATRNVTLRINEPCGRLTLKKSFFKKNFKRQESSRNSQKAPQRPPFGIAVTPFSDKEPALLFFHFIRFWVSPTNQIGKIFRRKLA
jgi:hypothetical protein